MTLSTLSSETSCEPRQATPRDPSRRTDGAVVAVLARLMGRRMPPWARAAVDVAGELTPEGRYAYPIVVVLVPRQSAKTTTLFDVGLGRGLAHADYRGAYAAQTGHVTTERFSDRYAEVARSPLDPRVKLRRSAGTERITFRSNGSYLKAFPPLDGALRGSALDFVAVDEAQEHDDEPLGVALDHTIMPTFTTRPRRQLWLAGTAPATPGTYLERYAALARAGAPGIALVDYGATPDDDPFDPATWALRHPGLAAGLTDVDFLAAQARLDPAGFVREHLNVWPKTRPGAVIPADAWETAQLAATPPRAGRIALAVDVAPGDAHATIAAAWATPAGVHAAVIQSAEGSRWLDAALADLVARWSPTAVGYDTIGPAAGVVTRLRIPAARPLGFADVSAGCAWFLAQLVDAPGTLTITPDEDLDRAAAAAMRREVGDSGRWAWGRKVTGQPIDALVACTLAAWLVAAPGPEPFLV